MSKVLFDRFLDDPAVYEDCERYWDTLVQGLSASIHQAGEWRRWIPRYYADGKTAVERDGNPILDGRSERLSRAFQIIQNAPTGGARPLSAWVKTYEPEFTDMPRSELVIALVLTDETARIVSRLLRRWMEPPTSVTEMESFIAEVLPV